MADEEQSLSRNEEINAGQMIEQGADMRFSRLPYTKFNVLNLSLSPSLFLRIFLRHLPRSLLERFEFFFPSLPRDKWSEIRAWRRISIARNLLNLKVWFSSDKQFEYSSPPKNGTAEPNGPTDGSMKDWTRINYQTDHRLIVTWSCTVGRLPID